MTDPQASKYPMVALSRVAEIRLGKMLQPAPSSPFDQETAYLRAGSLSGLGNAEELPRMWCSPTDRQKYSVLRGDLLVAEGGDVGRTEFAPELSETTVIQNSLHRVRSNRNDIRFLRYSLESIYNSGWLDVVCNKSTFGHLTVDKLSSLLVPRPTVAMQEAIADLLDSETARIDALVTNKQRMVELLEERQKVLFGAALEARGFNFPQTFEVQISRKDLPPKWLMMRLSQTLLQLTNGFVGPTRDILVDDGVRYVQSLHIKGGVIDFERRPFYVSQEWHSERPRIHLREGDVLIVQTGDIGQVAVVPPNFGEASCHALQIARVRSDIVSGDYLGAYLRSPFGYQSLLSRATGALHPHLEGGIRDIPVIVPPLDEQLEILDEVTRSCEPLREMRLRLMKQVDLLQERRQALVTAAVTGQFDLPEVNHDDH